MYLTIALFLLIIIITAILFILASKFKISPQLPPSLHEFSAPIRFEPFPDNIDINNPYKCTPDEPRTCNTNDLTSCIGCQSLMARCVHIENETKYFDANQNEFLLQPNTSPDEGYCLTLNETNLNIQCNVFHGDLALIQLQPNLPETMFFCNCKNPGLIGNTSILGACDTPFICNGQIENINDDIENIKCKCELSHISTRINDIPTCRRKTVAEASADNTLNDLNLSQNPSIMLSNTTENFHPTIVNNVNVANLRNPCSMCPVTGAQISNMSLGTVDDEKYCTINYTNFSQSNEIYGIPYRRSRLDRILAGENGPDAILGVWWYEVVIYTQLDSFVQRMIFKFEYSSANHDFYKQLNLDETKRYVIATDDLRLGVHLRIPPMSRTQQPGSLCLSRWPVYTCNWTQNRETQYSFNYDRFSEIDPRDGNSNIVPHLERTYLAGGFLWGRDPWNAMQRLNIYIEPSQSGDYLSHTTQFTLNQNAYAPDVQMIAYGFRRTADRGEWKTIILNNKNYNDWLLVQNRLKDIN